MNNLFNPPVTSQTEKKIVWQALYGASIALALIHSAQKVNAPLLVIVPDNLTASHLLDEIEFFSAGSLPVYLFPDWETLPYDHFSPHQDIISDRLATLFHIPKIKHGIVMTTVTNIMSRLAPPAFLDGQVFLLKTGDTLNSEDLKMRLTKAGYHHVSQVREHGEFAIRGSLIDIFPMGSKVPFRIDLFDEEIDSIRTFSTETQLSTEKVNAIHLFPAKEFPLTEAAIDLFRQQWRSQFTGDPLKCPLYQDISEGIPAPGIEYYLPFFFEQTATFFDYLPTSTIAVIVGEIDEKCHHFWEEISARYEQGKFDISRPLLKPEQIFISCQDLKTALTNYPRILINQPGKPAYSFETHAAPYFEMNPKAAIPFSPLKDFIETYSGRILFCVETLGRREVMLQLFKSIALTPQLFSSWQAFLESNVQHGMIVAPIEEGFTLKDPALTVLSETHLYGKRVMQRRLRKKSAIDPDKIIRNLTELQINDPVVHIDHGIGRYLGLQTLTIGDQTNEFLTLEYQGGDKLYVPVASLHLINRYSGTDPESVPINKLGTEQWQRAKRKAAEKVRDVAAELLELYAKRAAQPGHRYEIPEESYTAFAAAFPFEETPDQLQAIEQVFADMTSDKSMDRVICGDVGFGKTEVALRAAFLAAQNNKQTAVLVPTTLLAQQHFQNFQNRFADWPMSVEMLSRFRTSKEQKEILKKITAGTVDVVIGTHKLLQSDINFKSLGLVIVDEEHRFGVKQKEKLKSLRSSIDLLTLTATPIPRTLNMALSGIRDLSIIATPPARRLSVKTFIHEYQDTLIQEAIQREILRGGQVYFLHNDVSTINKKADSIAQLVKEARPIVAHGQMNERELERVMSDFYHRKTNVLVCSTIIESGIDIPTANTIIINRADKFGIAQLHQLRGRVGRSHHQAYAYLLVPPRTQLTADAMKRLDAIAALGELGVGFTLSTHDLEIRGAGELLGESQSGEMHEVGFTLYMDLLSRAVDALKAGKEPDFEKSFVPHRLEIDLHLTALIPESYLADVQLRLQFYKRMANAGNQQELDDIYIEMVDRFGLLPEPLKNLFAINTLKLNAESLGISKIEANEKGGKFEFAHQPNVKPENIIRLIQTQPQRFKLDGPTRLKFTLTPHEKTDRIMLVEQILESLKH